jgi:hypothetical protein
VPLDADFNQRLRALKPSRTAQKQPIWNQISLKRMPLTGKAREQKNPDLYNLFNVAAS